MSIITVIGYASLLSERSARDTVRGLQKFRQVRVVGHKRIFNKVGIVFFQKYQAERSGLRIASCATRPDPNYDIICSSFECNDDEFRLLYEREDRFRWILAEFINGDGSSGYGRMCTENTDENYLLNKCITLEEYQSRVGRYYDGKIWRSDILPFEPYLKFCLQAAESLGPEVYGNFLETSFLADGKTTIREYIQAYPGWDAAVVNAPYSY